MTAIVRRISPVLISIKNVLSDYTVPIEVIIFHKPSSNFTILHVKRSGVFNNITKPLAGPTPIIEYYNTSVTVRHNLEVTNTTKHYIIEIFSVNKTIVPPSNASATLNTTNTLLNKTGTKIAVPINRTAVPTNTTGSLSIRTANIANKTGIKTSVSLNKTTLPPFKTGSKPVMTLSQASLQFNWPIQTMDFNQLTYS